MQDRSGQQGQASISRLGTVGSGDKLINSYTTRGPVAAAALSNLAAALAGRTGKSSACATRRQLPLLLSFSRVFHVFYLWLG